MTIAYITNRKECLFNWFADSLSRQWTEMGMPQIEVVVVDFHYSEERRAMFSQHLNGSIKLTVVPPLPSPYQGEHRLTNENWFSAATARNTALVYAIHSYVMFCDDLAVLLPDWLRYALEGAKSGQVLQSAYRKDNEMAVENGVLISSVQTNEGTDSRQRIARGNRMYGKSDWCYGNTGMPLELALSVNGYCDLTSTFGYEDVAYGLVLQGKGAQFMYNPQMMAVESQEHHFLPDAYFKRHDPEIPEQEYRNVLNSLGVHYERPHNGRHDASHALLSIARSGKNFNTFDLRTLRAIREAAGEITVDNMNFRTSCWFTNKPLNELE